MLSWFLYGILTAIYAKLVLTKEDIKEIENTLALGINSYITVAIVILFMIAGPLGILFFIFKELNKEETE